MNRRDFAKTGLGGLLGSLALLLPGKAAGKVKPRVRLWKASFPGPSEVDPERLREAEALPELLWLCQGFRGEHTVELWGPVHSGDQCLWPRWDGRLGGASRFNLVGRLLSTTDVEQIAARLRVAAVILSPKAVWSATPDKRYPLGARTTAPDGAPLLYVRAADN